MRFSPLAVSVIFLPILLSCASPIERLPRRQTASYSVVAVDGGASGAAAATTVTAAASTLPPTTKLEVTTLFSTTVLTEIPTPTTIILTITSTAVATMMETIATTVSESAPTGLPVASRPISFSTITMSPTYTISNPVAVTVTRLPSSVPYDDGMWHTTYYHPALTSTVSSPSTTPASMVVSGYNATASNSIARPPPPWVTGLPNPLNWTAPVNYTNARV